MVSLRKIIKTADQDGQQVGQRLVEAGLITGDHLQIALHEQRRSGNMLGQVLVRLGFLSEGDLAAVLAERTGFEAVDLTGFVPDDALMEQLPLETAKRCRGLPLRLQHNRLELAIADPYDVIALDELRRHFSAQLEVVPLVASAAEIAEILNRYDHAAGQLNDILTELESGAADLKPKRHSEHWEHPIVRLVNAILTDGVRRGASDIHFEPESRFVRLRYRIDGSMQQIRALHSTHWPELSHRIKIMAGLNIADTRSLQDGRFEQTIGGVTIDFRVAVMPTAPGENIVIRILDHRRALLPLENLGFDHAGRQRLDQILDRPEGIILVTGPTGSGKTTTLYSMLNKISSAEVNIMTLEEPIEYRFELIRQTAIREGQGLGFAEGVRGVLRQDPDIIFIGEVRDPDTAQMALRAAMTGHQVFSTLHCNDALGALPRLIDLGLHPRMLAGHVSGVVAQRLVRKLCQKCKTMRAANDDEKKLLDRDVVATSEPTLAGFAEMQAAYTASAIDCPIVGQAVGCDHCRQTGYRGRIAIAEVLRVTPALDELITADVPRSQLKAQIESDGFQPIAASGIAQLRAGTVDYDSLRRAIDLTRLD